jgi:hypothetical protein
MGYVHLLTRDLRSNLKSVMGRRRRPTMLLLLKTILLETGHRPAWFRALALLWRTPLTFASRSDIRLAALLTEARARMILIRLCSFLGHFSIPPHPSFCLGAPRLLAYRPFVRQAFKFYCTFRYRVLQWNFCLVSSLCWSTDNGF